MNYEARGEQSAQNWHVEHKNLPMEHDRVAHRSGEAGLWSGGICACLHRITPINAIKGSILLTSAGGSAPGQDSLVSDMLRLHFPIVPAYTSTAPLGLNLRAASPVNRMTITGAPSGIAPVPVTHAVVTRLSPDAFVAATRASYQENSRQVYLFAPLIPQGECCCQPAWAYCFASPPRSLSRPWTASLISTSEQLVAFRPWGKGDCPFGHQDIIGRTLPSSAPHCF